MTDKILSFFGFTRIPFSKTIPTREVFKSSMLEGLFAMFNLGVENEDILLVYGGVGCGKTVALRLFMQNLDSSRYHPVYIKGGNMNAGALYKNILTSLKVEPPSRSFAARKVYEKTINESRKKPVIILDDGQDLQDDALSELKTMVNFDTDSSNKLTIVLAGQPELYDRLGFTLFAPVMQRIRLSYNLGSLNLEETCRYINHQLTICGADNSIFTDDANSEIFKRSGGVPRIINRECFKAIIIASAKGKNIIEPSVLPAPDLQEQ